MDFIKDLNSGSAWLGHMDFARELVAKNKIKNVLELGTYGGHSLFSFAQGMNDSKVKGNLTSIDMWAGGADNGSDDMYENVQKVATKHFPKHKFTFIRKSFEDAKGLVKNDSMDLIHIDGKHDYESVRADFDNYFKKLKKGGYILFHDTQVKNRGNEFQVHRLFAELQTEHPEWEFSERTDSFGLGIIKTNL